MAKLIRDKRTGDYYSEDKKFHIEKCLRGWNVNELDGRLSKLCGTEIYSYSFSCDTLWEVRQSI